MTGSGGIEEDIRGCITNCDRLENLMADEGA